jgi:hypothetical protein
VGTPQKCDACARDTSGANTPRLGLSPPPGRAWRDDHGGARLTFAAAERSKVLTVDGVQRRVLGWWREHARGPKGPTFIPCTHALRQPRGKGHDGVASGSTGLGVRGKRSQRLDLAYQTMCARACSCTCWGHGHGGDLDGDSDAAAGTANA